ncbi:HlyD family efflux transporter periplasmic adaptor subunit [Romboutsia weinsteinii]|uniref:HlyD family efflux transporter periplasmic adaptor subunit n=1 Tax=Romboutsia weinsteinii TaxID=2020949 RepID=A0A255I3T3_9FIRM|nr:SH3 domain-containing protein [Romboutsia weinsteinii]RDY26292.1 HlyD family efflux transporter periplasmic adaptor subunit [Romboutsia weinsteinii]
MKKPKKLIVIGVVSLSILGAGAFVGINQMEEKNQQEIATIASMNNVSSEKGDLRVTISIGGKVTLIDSEGSNLNDLKLTLKLNEYDISKVQLNQTVEIKAKAFPEDIIKGKIVDISNKSEEGENASYIVTVSIPKRILETGENKYNETNVRKGPTKEYETVAKIEKGKNFEILERKNSWMKIKLEDGTEGWISKDSVALKGINKENEHAKISKSDINLKASNSAGSKNLMKLTQNEDVKIIDKKDKWYKVEVDIETSGWVTENDLIIGDLRDGMAVTATILVSEKKDIVKVPVSSVQKDEKGYYVIVADTNEKKYVDIGITDSEYIEITNGLSEGEKINLSLPINVSGSGK